MDEETVELIRFKYETSIVVQKEAFKAQSGTGDRAKLAGIAAQASRVANDNRRKYENAIYEFWKEQNDG